MALELQNVFFLSTRWSLKSSKKNENNCYLKKLFQGSIFKQEYNNQNLNYKQKSLKLTCERNLRSENILISLFEPSVAFHTETNRLFCSSKQTTGFYMICNTGLKWVKGLDISIKTNELTWSWFSNCSFSFLV